MKTILQILLFLLSMNIYASEEHSNTLKYSIDEESLLFPSITNAYSFKEHFEDFGFFSLSNTPLVKSNQLFDFLYFNNQLKQFITVKSGISVEKENYNKLFFDQAESQYVLHLIHNKVSYVIMFFNFNESEIKNITQNWIKKDTPFSVVNLFFPSAHARDMCMGNLNYTQKSILQLSRTANALEDDSLTKEISKCALDTLKGVKNNASESLTLFKTLITDPKKLWKETSQSVKAISSLVRNLNVEIKNIVSALSSISPELKSELVCMMAGNAVGGMISSLILGPSAVAKSLPLMTLKLKSMADQIKKIEGLKSRGIRLRDKDKFFKEVVNCEI